MKYWGNAAGQDEEWDLQHKLDEVLRWCCCTGWKMGPATQTWCNIKVMLLDRMNNGTCDTNLMQHWGYAAGQKEKLGLKSKLDAVLRWCCWTGCKMETAIQTYEVLRWCCWAGWKMEPATQTWCSIEVMLLSRMKNGTCNTNLMQYWGDAADQDEKWNLHHKLDAVLRWCCWTG